MCTGIGELTLAIDRYKLEGGSSFVVTVPLFCDMIMSSLKQDTHLLKPTKQGATSLSVS